MTTDLPAVLAVVVASAFSSWALLGFLIPLLKRKLLDHPNARSAHLQPIPRGGGIAFVLVSSVFSLTAIAQGAWSPLVALPLLALPLALVGVLDDRHNLPAAWRYGVQTLTALAVLWFSPLARSLPAALPVPVLWLPLAFLLLIAITAVINFTNFMDGLDGLVASCLTITLATAAIQLRATPLALWPLVGALLGFLSWNWSPARVFMGDVGSTFLGALFAAAVLQASSWTLAMRLLLVCTPVLADACLCVLRRLLAGQPVFRAHRLHLFQRLQQAGWSHRQVSGLYLGATGLLAFAELFAGWLALVWMVGVLLALGLHLDRRVAVPFAVSVPHQQS